MSSNKKENARLSKFISLVLRHKPDQIGLRLDENGWADVQELIDKLNDHGAQINFSLLEEIVVNNDKQRFGFNDNRTMIRASQGHSIEVDLNLQSTVPPDILYHGTAKHNLESIMDSGITAQQRQHVHLSAEISVAKKVGARHGSPIVLEIDARAMYESGQIFFLSDNRVWLTSHVQPNFISVLI